MINRRQWLLANSALAACFALGPLLRFSQSEVNATSPFGRDEGCPIFNASRNDSAQFVRRNILPAWQSGAIGGTFVYAVSLRSQSEA